MLVDGNSGRSAVGSSDRKGAMQRRTFVSASLGALAGAAVTGAVTRNRRTAPSRTSYSQEGEDLLLFDFLTKIRSRPTGTYLDIGAADPIEANNTYLLYLAGSRGVLVEPNPAHVENLRRVRPEDTVVAAGIGTADTRSAPYYLIRGKPQLNTFSAERAADLERTLGRGIVEGVIQVPLLSVNDVIARHLGKAPDILSIDVEGLEMAILRTLDFGRHRPGAICVETVRGTSGINPEVGEFLATKDYVARAGTFVNTVFVDAGHLKE
jgi:FkbM family methyltransferase